MDAKRDWGHSKDYVEAMWLMLQHDTPGDYNISTDKAHSVRDFVEMAFNHIGVTIQWEGEGVNEVGRDSNTGVIRVLVNPKFYRPNEEDITQGNSSKARNVLGWKPKYDLKALVEEMVECDIELMKKKQG